jgi:hypothetical protein
MSSLLEQAIIDAKMLKETARKNAEAQILEERAEEIKRKIEMLFEEEDPLLGLGTDTTTPAAGGEVKPEVKKTMDRIPPSYLGEGEGEIEINLESLVQKVSELEEEMGVVPQNVGRLPADQIQVEGDTGEDVAEDQLNEGEGDKDREVAAVTEKSAAELKAKAAAQRAKGAQADKKERETAEREKKETKPAASQEETELYEEFTLEEDSLEEDEVVEELVLDMDNVSPGGINANEIELKKQQNVSKALYAQGKTVDGELEEENADLAEALVEKATEAAELEEQLNAAIAKLQETKEKLKKSVNLNVQLKEGVEMLSRKVGEVNLLNARLLYTNKTLGNSSLNERQKKQIAESVSSARTVEEARVIYETLQRSVQDVTERRSAPQSLTEALNKAPAPFLPRKENVTADPLKTRWQAIAGIKPKN